MRRRSEKGSLRVGRARRSTAGKDRKGIFEFFVPTKRFATSIYDVGAYERAATHRR